MEGKGAVNAEMRELAELRRESWARQMRAAVARYEAQRGSLEGIAELANILRDRRSVTGEGVALVGGYRYRLVPGADDDVMREPLAEGRRSTRYSGDGRPR